VNFWTISDILQKNIILHGLIVIFDLNDVNIALYSSCFYTCFYSL